MFQKVFVAPVEFAAPAGAHKQKKTCEVTYAAPDADNRRQCSRCFSYSAGLSSASPCHEMVHLKEICAV